MKGLEIPPKKSHLNKVSKGKKHVLFHRAGNERERHLCTPWETGLAEISHPCRTRLLPRGPGTDKGTWAHWPWLGEVTPESPLGKYLLEQWFSAHRPLHSPTTQRCRFDWPGVGAGCVRNQQFLKAPLSIVLSLRVLTPQRNLKRVSPPNGQRQIGWFQE